MHRFESVLGRLNLCLTRAQFCLEQRGFGKGNSLHWSRLYPYCATALLAGFLSVDQEVAFALQQRVMVIDYGFSQDDINRVFAKAPAGSLIVTGPNPNAPCAVDRCPNPTFDSYAMADFIK